MSTLDRVEVLDPRDVPFRDVKADRTVYLMRSLSADSSMDRAAGSYVIGIGGQREMVASSERHPDFDVAAMVEFASRDQAVAAVVAHESGLYFLANEGKRNFFSADRNLGLLNEAFADVAKAPGAKVIYDGGVESPREPRLDRGDFVTVGRAGAREASPDGHMGITRDSVLSEKWVVAGFSGGRVALNPTNGNPYARSISAEAVNLTRFDVDRAAELRALRGDREGHRELMTLRANAERHRDPTPLAPGDVVMLGSRASQHVAEFLRSGATLRAASLPWRVDSIEGGFVKLTSYAGGGPLEAHVRDPSVTRLREGDVALLRGLAANGPDRDLAAAVVAVTRPLEAWKAVAVSGEVKSPSVIEVKVTKEEVSGAISMLNYARPNPRLSDVANVIADLAPAIAQPEWGRKAEHGVERFRMVQTGEVKSGREALVALRDGFGVGEYRKLAFDADHVRQIVSVMGPRYGKTHEGVLEEAAGRSSASKGLGQPKSAKFVGASR